MQLYILISMVSILLVAGIAIVFIIAMRSSLAKRDLITAGKHPQGYWMSIGISTGIGLGLALGVALENLAIGIAIGAGIGAGIGAALEHKNKDKVRPLTEQEKKMQKWGVALGLVMLLLFAGFFSFFLFLKTR